MTPEGFPKPAGPRTGAVSTTVEPRPPDPRSAGPGDAPADPLWAGDGDPALARVQAVLRPLRYRPQPLPERCYPTRRGVPRWRFALAAALLIAVGSLAGIVWRFSWPSGAAWTGRLVSAEGQVLTAVTLAPGRELQVPGDAWAELAIARLGHLHVAPGSTLRLSETRTGRHRAELLQGRLQARVWAPPGAFGVALGQTEAIDMGCVFTLSRDAAGHGQLHVQSGWVLLSGPRDSLVPAGARAEIDAIRGPGTPHRNDASPALRAALAAIDAAEGRVAAAGPEVAGVLAAATDADALSLVALLSRYPTLADGPLLPRAAAALPQAPTIDRDRLRRGDRTALDPLWDALPYPRAKFWWLHWRDAFTAPATESAG